MTPQLTHPEPDIGFGNSIVDEAYRLAIMSVDDEGKVDLEKINRNFLDLRASHTPHQSDRDKVLDDIIGMFDNGNYNGITVKQMITGKFKEIELHQKVGEQK
jgi:hypothetical protein